jgi:GGDEF domain-containing protein
MSAERTSRAAIAAQELCEALWEALHEQLKANEEERAAALAERIAEVSRSVSALVSAAPSAESADVPAVKRSTAAAASRRAVAPQAQRHASQTQAVIVDEQHGSEAPISIRDARHAADGEPWTTAVQRRLERYLDDSDPFAVLLVELLDSERLRLAQSPIAAESQLREVESAVVEQLRPADVLVREADGRYWLVAPGTAAQDARGLALRLVDAVRRCASYRRVPLEVAVGIAVCPDHGVQAAGLTSHAEVDLYAAQAAGRAVSD